MQLRSNPDFMHDDFEMFSRVWRSIEYLCLTPGLRKKYAREVGIRTVPQHQISPNFLFWGLFRGGRTRKIGHYAEIQTCTLLTRKGYGFRDWVSPASKSR